MSGTHTLPPFRAALHWLISRVNGHWHCSGIAFHSEAREEEEITIKTQDVTHTHAHTARWFAIKNASPALTEDKLT